MLSSLYVRDEHPISPFTPRGNAPPTNAPILAQTPRVNAPDLAVGQNPRSESGVDLRRDRLAVHDAVPAERDQEKRHDDKRYGNACGKPGKRAAAAVERLSVGEHGSQSSHVSVSLIVLRSDIPHRTVFKANLVEKLGCDRVEIQKIWSQLCC